MYAYKNKQSGVASIFIVIFFMLLISIIVLGFAQIVSQDQRQSTNADLSSSAYDSAQAGVEDAKRALAQYKKDCVETNQQGSSGCITKYTDTSVGAFSGKSCTVFQEKLGGSSDLKLDVDSATKEVQVTTDTSDKDLDQAYTCLRVSLNTKDYKRTLDDGNTIIVPLKAVSGVPQTIQLNWFDKSQAATVVVPSTTSNFSLPKNSAADAWNKSTPPVMRAQIMAVPKTNFSVDEVDNNSRAVFLYPSSNGSNTVDMTFNDVGRRSPKNSPVAAKCNAASASYACSVGLTNFAPGPPADYNYYLRLMPVYNGANLQIQMYDASNSQLTFDGVEPEVDSTGRANDVFRRVVSRIAFDSDTNGIDVTQGICKNFRLADGTTYYSFDCSGKNELVNE